MPDVKQETLNKILEDAGKMTEEIQTLRQALAKITQAQDLEEAVTIAYNALDFPPQNTAYIRS